MDKGKAYAVVLKDRMPQFEELQRRVRAAAQVMLARLRSRGLFAEEEPGKEGNRGLESADSGQGGCPEC
jgi:hypothetical protein